jgi:hypothetical protein
MYSMGESVSAIIISGGLHVGEHEVRLSQGRAYVHIPAKTVEGLTSRRVKVLARVNAERCEERGLHGLLLSFTATLIKAGGTYRINLPSYYYTLASKIAKCGRLEVLLVPRG